MSVRLLHPHPEAPVPQSLPSPFPPRRASRLRRWQFTPQPSRLRTVFTSTLVVPSPHVLLSFLHISVHEALELHPRWYSSTFGPVPGLGSLRRQHHSRPSGHPAITSYTDVATPYMVLQAARRRLVRRHDQQSRTPHQAPVPLAGTLR